ncbi:MAG: hypothetical protein HYZ44_01215 [Bacteroidetes bacterium]|nr:hypothetical protein [Bacteroidota bacterium]
MRTHIRYTFLIQSVLAILLIFGNAGSFSVSSGVQEVTRTEWVSVHKDKPAFQLNFVKANTFHASSKLSFEFQLLQVARKTHQQGLLCSTVYSYLPRFLFHTHSLCPEGNQLIA